MTITAAQVKTARELLGWSQAELSAQSRVPKITIAEFEEGAQEVAEGSVTHLHWALLKAGIEFIPESCGSASAQARFGRCIVPGET